MWNHGTPLWWIKLQKKKNLQSWKMKAQSLSSRKANWAHKMSPFLPSFHDVYFVLHSMEAKYKFVSSRSSLLWRRKEKHGPMALCQCTQATGLWRKLSPMTRVLGPGMPVIHSIKWPLDTWRPYCPSSFLPNDTRGRCVILFHLQFVTHFSSSSETRVASNVDLSHFGLRLLPPCSLGSQNSCFPSFGHEWPLSIDSCIFSSLTLWPASTLFESFLWLISQFFMLHRPGREPVVSLRLAGRWLFWHWPLRVALKLAMSLWFGPPPASGVQGAPVFTDTPAWQGGWEVDGVSFF